MADIVRRLRSGAKAMDTIQLGGVPHDPRMLEAADEIERLRDVLNAIEWLTATGDGLAPDHCIDIHILAAEGRSDDPCAWRADPVAIERLRAALRAEAQHD